MTLNYMLDGRSFVVIASYGGEEGPERESLWNRIVTIDPTYIEYQQRTERRLPVVVLEPSG